MVALARTSDVLSVQSVFYRTVSWYGVFYIMHHYVDVDGSNACGFHRGCKTGRFVTFSRQSDAERLCAVLNAQIEERA